MIQNWLVSKLFAKIFCPTSMKSAEEHRCQFSFFFSQKLVITIFVDYFLR